MTKGIGKFDKYASRFFIKYIQRSFHTLMGEVAIYIQFYFLLSGIFGYLISKFWAPFSPHDSCVYVFALQFLPKIQIKVVVTWYRSSAAKLTYKSCPFYMTYNNAYFSHVIYFYSNFAF